MDIEFGSPEFKRVWENEVTARDAFGDMVQEELFAIKPIFDYCTFPELITIYEPTLTYKKTGDVLLYSLKLTESYYLIFIPIMPEGNLRSIHDAAKVNKVLLKGVIKNDK